MAYPRYGRSFGMRVGGWWGQWRLDSRDVQWPLIGCLILLSKYFSGAMTLHITLLYMSYLLQNQSRLSIFFGAVVFPFRVFS